MAKTAKKSKTKPKAKLAAKKPLVRKVVAKKSATKKTATNKIMPKKTTAKKLAAKASAPKKIIKKMVKRVPRQTLAPKGPYGLPEQLRDVALKVLDERQADDIVTVSLAGRSAMADYMIIASGRASKQLSAIAHYLREEFEKLGVTQIRTEGQGEGNWVLMDAGDVLIHLFRPEVRKYYNLEQIWTRSARPAASDADAD